MIKLINKIKEKGELFMRIMQGNVQLNGNSTNRTFIEIIEEMNSGQIKFPANYLPELNFVKDGDKTKVFIKPRHFIRSMSDRNYVKYLVLQKDFVPVHGHHYQYVELPSEGYIAKFILPMNSFSSISSPTVFIDYIVDINNVNSLVEIPGTSVSERIMDDWVPTYMFSPYESQNPEYHRFLNEVATPGYGFFDKYLRDAEE